MRRIASSSQPCRACRRGCADATSRRSLRMSSQLTDECVTCVKLTITSLHGAGEWRGPTGGSGKRNYEEEVSWEYSTDRRANAWNFDKAGRDRWIWLSLLITASQTASQLRRVTVVRLSAASHVLALGARGELYAWGTSACGVLGIGPPSELSHLPELNERGTRFSPTPVPLKARSSQRSRSASSPSLPIPLFVVPLPTITFPPANELHLLPFFCPPCSV